MQVGFGPFVSTAFFVAVAAEIVVRLFFISLTETTQWIRLRRAQGLGSGSGEEAGKGECCS